MRCMQLAGIVALWVSYSSHLIGQQNPAGGQLPTVPSNLSFEPSAAGFTNPVQSAQNLLDGPRQDVINIPVQGLADASSVEVRGDAVAVSIFARDVDLRIVLAHLAEEAKVNIVIGPSVEAMVNTTLKDVPLWRALDAILEIHGLTWIERENIIYVTQPSAAATSTGQPLNRGLRGQILEVFDLNYVSGMEVLPIAQSLLSTSGRAHIHQVDRTSTRQTRERLIVEDFADRLQVIHEYLAGVDSPPQQVLIEAHVLQVTLDNDQRHGVNLDGLARITNSRVQVRAQGFASEDASPGFMLGLDGNDLDGMIECLQSSSMVRTLAAPKVMVVNGQEARIQIGSKFGYFETTTTQTGTFQSVNFLDIGVVLVVEPTITPDGQVMLSVQPKVSGGRVNPESGLPEEETTEAQTTVILPDGKGMIIGGLIKEEDNHKKSWVPWLGEKPFIGKLFSRSNDEKQRVEVIIAITPHIVPYVEMIAQRENQAYIRSTHTHGVLSGAAGAYTPANQYPDYQVIRNNPFDQGTSEELVIPPDAAPLH